MGDGNELMGDGSLPSRYVEFFGPAMWKTPHAVSFTYPLEPTENDKKNYDNFFKAVGPVVPCPSCSMHYRKFAATRPPALESRASLTKWVYDLHDLANKDGHKVSPTFEEVQRRYGGWTKADNKAFQGTNRRYRIKRMADPHFDVLPGAGNQSPLEDVSSRNMIGIAIIVFLVIALALAAYIWYRRNKEMHQKKDKYSAVPKHG
jgi:hypothetical protein